VPLQLAVVVLVGAAAVGTSCSDDVTNPIADAGQAQGTGATSSSHASSGTHGTGGAGGRGGSGGAAGATVGEGG